MREDLAMDDNGTDHEVVMSNIANKLRNELDDGDLTNLNSPGSNDANADLSRAIHHAEHRVQMAEKESESRMKTIEQVQNLHAQSVNDLNDCNSQLSLRNQQINNLKDTIKQLQEQITDITSAKQAILIDNNTYKAEITTQNELIQQYNSQIQDSQKDLLQHPSYVELKSKFDALNKQVEIEKEGRIAALSAWQKIAKKTKEREVEFKAMRFENEEMQQQLKWEREKLECSKEANQGMRTDYKAMEQENVELKLRINSLETQIQSQSQIEQMKTQNIIDNAMTEMKWREHILVQQLEKYKHDFDKVQIEKYKFQKALKSMEVELEGHGNPLYNDNNNNTKQTITKYKFLELTELDSEISKLKREIKQNNQRSKGVNPTNKWMITPPPMTMNPPLFMNSPNMNMNNNMYQLQPQQYMTNNNNIGMAMMTPVPPPYPAPIVNRQSSSMVKNSVNRQSSHRNGNIQRPGNSNARKSNNSFVQRLTADAGYSSHHHNNKNNDNFWADMQGTTSNKMDNMQNRYSHFDYPNSYDIRTKKKRKNSQAKHKTSQSPSKAKKIQRKKVITNSRSEDKPRWK